MAWGFIKNQYETVQNTVLFAGQHIGELCTVAHQVPELPDIRRWNKAGLDHTAHIQVANPFCVLTVSFVTLLRLRVFGMCQCDPAGLFEDVEYGNPVFSCGFHTDIRTGILGEPVSQLPQSFGERRKASLLVFRSSVSVGDADAGIDPGLVNIQTTTVLPKNLKSHTIPPNTNLKDSAGTGHPAKSSRFERDKFTGYLFAPIVDALTDDRHHIQMRGCRYTAPPLTSTGSVVYRTLRGYCNKS